MERSKYLSVDGTRVYNLFLLGMWAEHLRQQLAGIQDPSMTIKHILSVLVAMGLISTYEVGEVGTISNATAFQTRMRKDCGMASKGMPVVTPNQTRYWCGAMAFNFRQLMKANTVRMLEKGLQDAHNLQSEYPQFSWQAYCEKADEIDPQMNAGKKKRPRQK